MTCFAVFSQDTINKRFAGVYIIVKNSNVVFTIWLNKSTYGIFLNDPAFKKKTESIYYGDVVEPEFNYKGNVKIKSDTIYLDFNGEIFLVLEIIDSLRLKNTSSLLGEFKNDTLFRVQAYFDKSNFYWIYTFYH